MAVQTQRSTSRDFCNSFWGAGDDGPNVLFMRMRSATKTSDELKNFWHERSIIEEEYASRLAKLAKNPIGGDEIGELRNSLDTLRLETEKQAANHLQLANQLRLELEASAARFHVKQVTHRRQYQAPLERKFKSKQTQEAYVTKAREKYETDCQRIHSFTQQVNYLQGVDLDRVQLRLVRARQTVQANEKDLATFTKGLLELLPEWENEWKEFCDTCQDLEEERMDFMKDTLWSYANDVSTVCVDDDQSCERIRTALDQMEPEREVEHFIEEQGTGSEIYEVTEFIPGESSTGPPAPTIRPAKFLRNSQRPAPAYPDAREAEIQSNSDHHASSDAPVPTQNGSTTNQGQHSTSQTVPQAEVSPPPTETASLTVESNLPARHIRDSHPLPVPDRGNSSNHPLPKPTDGVQILFYVKALYDYTASTREEFDFQAGDVIAVTATPDDGWWSGELLDEARREEGRHVFPSNFVCLF